MKITVFEPKPNENIRKFGVSFEYHIARNYLTIRISREIGKLPNAQNVNGFISVVLRETRKSNFLCTFNNAIGISRVPVRFRQNRLRNIKDAGPSSTGRTGGRTRRNYTGAIIRFLRFHHGTLKTGSSLMGIFFFFFYGQISNGRSFKVDISSGQPLNSARKLSSRNHKYDVQSITLFSPYV